MFQRIISVMCGNDARRKSRSDRVAKIKNRCWSLMDTEQARTVFVNNLAEKISLRDLKSCFSKYGNIKSCWFIKYDDRNNSALIIFSSTREASRVIKYGNKMQIRLHDRDLRVMPYTFWLRSDNRELYDSNMGRINEIWDQKNMNNQYTHRYLQNDSKSASIHILNDDCLRHIFKFLPILDRFCVEKVCKRWRTVGLESWYTIKVLDLSFSDWIESYTENMDKIYAFTVREVLRRCGKYLTRLDMSEHCHWLTHMLYTDKDLFNLIAQSCPNLTDIDLKGIQPSYSDIDALVKNCKNITKFAISWSFDLDKILHNLFSIHKNLEYLEINSRLSGSCLNFLPAETMRTLILRDGCRMYNLSSNLKRLRGLEKLVIQECHAMDEDTLRNISQYNINLKVLDLQVSCFETTITSLNVTNLVKLEIVKIANNEGMSDDYIANMVLNCRNLIDVTIEDCHDVTDAGLVSIATLPKLERLNINYMKGLTDRSLCHIRNLKVFECQQCTFTEKGLSMVLASSPQLRLLDISKCSKISKRFVRVAEEACNRRANNVLLKMIVNLPSFYSLPEYSCISFIEVSPFLQILDMRKRDVSKRNSQLCSRLGEYILRERARCYPLFGRMNYPCVNASRIGAALSPIRV